jgi:hypothetical protein
MSSVEPTPPPGAGDDPAAALGHPRGTLAIVIIFGVLFALGWFAMYLLRFAGQGIPHH